MELSVEMVINAGSGIDSERDKGGSGRTGAGRCAGRGGKGGPSG